MLKFVILLLSVVVASTSAVPFLHEVNIDKSLNWRIVGGNDAADGAFPFIVSVRGWLGSHTCGGSILNTEWVLTAAHCVVGSRPDSFNLQAGSNTLDYGGNRYPLDEIISHPDYDSLTIQNDIALLRVGILFEFTDLIQPVVLPTTEVEGGVDVSLAGWGTTSEPGSVPNQLQYLNLRTISYDKCVNRLSPNPVFESQLCTLTRAGEGACRGDSGGPLVEGSVLQGVVSWGIPCGLGFPDVFTRVTYFLPWINANVGSS